MTGPTGPARAVRLAGDRVSARVEPRAAAVAGGAGLLAAVLGVWLLVTGEFPLAVGDVLAALAGQADSATQFVVTGIRLPRVAAALGVGAALGAGGAVFQAVTRNPLGSPDLLGFSTGAATGALVVLLVAPDVLRGAGAAGGAVVGGALTAAAVFGLSWRGGVLGSRFVLVGVATNAALLAVNATLLARAPTGAATSAEVWVLGTLNARTWSQLAVLAAVLFAVAPVLTVLASSLRLLALGDDLATTLGIAAGRRRLALLATATVLVGAAVATAGPIAFVALAGPPLARLLSRTGGPAVLTSAAVGAVLLLAADAVAQRAFGDTQLPAGVVTTTLGGVYWLWLLRREAR